MALSKSNYNFFGFPTDIYVKIGGMLVRETGSDETGKLYSMEVQVDNYTNATKEYHVWQTTKSFKNLRIEELTLETAYAKLASEPEFEGFVSV